MTLNSGMHFLGVISGSRSMYPREAFQGALAAVTAIVVVVLCHGVAVGAETEAEAGALLAAGAVVGAAASATASLRSTKHWLVQFQSHDLVLHLSLALVLGAILCLAGFEVWSTVGFYTWTLLFGTWQVGMQLEINMNDVYVE